MLNLISKYKVTWLAFDTQKVTFNGEEMPNVLDTFDVTKVRAQLLKSQKLQQRKIKSKKIKTLIKAIITLTQVVCATKTLIIVLAFNNLIV